jgi:hypothetical protein
MDLSWGYFIFTLPIKNGSDLILGLYSDTGASYCFVSPIETGFGVFLDFESDSWLFITRV